MLWSMYGAARVLMQAGYAVLSTFFYALVAIFATPLFIGL